MTLKAGHREKPAPAWISGAYAPHLAKLRGKRLSGVYAILSKRAGTVLYVGESHSARLYDTITRHFRAWERPARLKYAGGRTRGGVTYDRADVLVGYTITNPDDAPELQYGEIARLAPRDNEVMCETDRCAAVKWKPEPTTVDPEPPAP
ncbi:MAG: hypothetical protein K2X32_06875 [Phycisphaerales bacterium]|nr:hypothetical protein [Phycisphaerales bacterium]